MVVNAKWMDLAPMSVVYHLTRLKSDRRPLLLHSAGSPSIQRPRLFRFLAGWTLHPQFNKAVNDNWSFQVLDNGGNGYLIDKELQIRTCLEEILDHEELLWYQKSRSEWIQDGDRNTKFFHSRTLARRQSDRIQALKIQSNEWCYDDEILHTEAKSFFAGLYRDDGGRSGKFPIRGIFPSLSNEDIQRLDAVVTNEETKRA
ncbi:uncharacterized protein LOC120181302 [Hibiscus syriacus]|uniref:uncharacterized protein LOC120181302 n=1 Tax=Hibiscus syriacus TaxID=106335 RepID=UPI0019221A88|nr:uncharacterized protein LOC120181302 [Hibiscus syriacus]